MCASARRKCCTSSFVENRAEHVWLVDISTINKHIRDWENREAVKTGPWWGSIWRMPAICTDDDCFWMCMQHQRRIVRRSCARYKLLFDQPDIILLDAFNGHYQMPFQMFVCFLRDIINGCVCRCSRDLVYSNQHFRCCIMGILADTCVDERSLYRTDVMHVLIMVHASDDWFSYP